MSLGLIQARSLGLIQSRCGYRYASYNVGLSQANSTVNIKESSNNYKYSKDKQ